MFSLVYVTECLLASWAGGVEGTEQITGGGCSEGFLLVSVLRYCWFYCPLKRMYGKELRVCVEYMIS